MEKHIFIRKNYYLDTFGGSEKHILDWFKAIDYSYCEINLIVSPYGKNIFLPQIEKLNLPIKIIEFPFYSNKLIKRSWLNLFITLKRLRPTSVIFSEGAFGDFGFLYLFAAFLATKGRVFMSEHLAPCALPEKERKKYLNFIPALGLWWYKWTFLNVYLMGLRSYFCRKILAVSKEVQELMIKNYFYRSSKIKTIYHGIDTDIFTKDNKIRNEERGRLQIGNSSTVVISTSRLAKVKRVDILINAFDELSAKYKNLYLLVLGNGPLENELKKLASEKRSSSKIIFLGYIHDISRYLKMSDIFVLTSNNEGLSIALLESLATGVFSIVTKTPGPQEILKDQNSGLLVEKDYQSIVDGITFALNIPYSERNRLALLGRNQILDKFDLYKQSILALDLFEIKHA